MSKDEEEKKPAGPYELMRRILEAKRSESEQEESEAKERKAKA